MRIETHNQSYDGYELIMDTTHECPVDTEYTLPDYCADIQKILKCIVTPEITAAVPVGDSLSVEGTADIRVLYLDAKGECVRGFDTKKDFSLTVRLNESITDANVSVHPNIQHMTCRALNARRVDIHITLGLSIAVSALRHLEIPDSMPDNTIETRCEQYRVSRAAGCTTHSFILDENMDLQNGKPTVDAVLRRSVRYSIEEIQVLSGEIRFSGKACVEVLYRSFSDSILPERMLFELPFTQSVECTGADEQCSAEIRHIGGTCSVQPREDSVGEYTVLNLYLKPVFGIRLTKPYEVSSVCDAFAVRGAFAAKYKTYALEHLENNANRTVRVRENVYFTENDLERILDIWCDNLSVSSFSEKDGNGIRGRFSLCILYLTKEKKIAFTERMLDFTEKGSSDTEGRVYVKGIIDSVRFSISDTSTMECIVELQLNEQVRTVHSVRALIEADLDKDVPEDNCCAAVYYADAGESVWDIAKRYKARVEAIKKHNGCTADRMEISCPVIICRK